jgi:hypothetical protein
MAAYDGHVSKRQRVDDNDHYNRVIYYIDI